MKYHHSAILVATFLSTALYGCGGGDDTTEQAPPPAGSGSGGPAADVAAFAGTYSLKSAGTTIGSFMLDKSATVTVCAFGTEASCTADVAAPVAAGGKTTFKLKGDSKESTISGEITAAGSVEGELSTLSGTTQQVSGTKVSANFIDCEGPSTRLNGQCTPPKSGFILAPGIVRFDSFSQLGRTYRFAICATPSPATFCDDISPNIFVSYEDLADAETPEIIAYANSVQSEFQKMIGRLMAAKTYPTRAQYVQIFSKALEPDIKSGTRNAIQAAGAGFNAAGFPAAAGGQATSQVGTAPTPESECGQLRYTGDTSAEQVFLYDKLAQFEACLYNTTKNDQFLDAGNRQCRVLDGLLKDSINYSFKPLFCNGPRLKY